MNDIAARLGRVGLPAPIAFWLWGAAAHQAGSVIGPNGPNAPAAVLGRPVR
jgi:hypothetical protein